MVNPGERHPLLGSPAEVNSLQSTGIKAQGAVWVEAEEALGRPDVFQSTPEGRLSIEVLEQPTSETPHVVALHTTTTTITLRAPSPRC